MDDDDEEEEEIADSLPDLSASDNAVFEHTLKQMLIILQKGIQKDLSRSIVRFQLQVDEIGDCTDEVERQLTDFTDANNELVYAHCFNALNLSWQILRTALEETTIKIWGIPESVPPQELTQYLQSLFNILVPSLSAQDLLIDKVHRI